MHLKDLFKDGGSVFKSTIWADELDQIRQLLDPNVSLEDLEAYSDMEEEWEDIE